MCHFSLCTGPIIERFLVANGGVQGTGTTAMPCTIGDLAVKLGHNRESKPSSEDGYLLAGSLYLNNFYKKR
jgi:hypothetical protein